MEHDQAGYYLVRRKLEKADLAETTMPFKKEAPDLWKKEDKEAMEQDRTGECESQCKCKKMSCTRSTEIILKEKLYELGKCAGVMRSDTT